ncbi:MAG: AAA family ATPase [Dehalococcoidia bacterium]|nr:AAA family ATPase [Dehalococcoidia bacterium]
MTAADRLSPVLARLEELTCRPVRYRNGTWAALCPAHDDQHRSLSLSEGEDGRVLIRCHAGCDTEAVLERLGLSWADLFPPGERRNGHQPDKRQAQQPGVADPLTWWAERCGVPREWLRRLPIEAKDGAIAFTWPTLGVAKLRSPEAKGYWAGDGPRPPFWPALAEAMPPVLVLCEGESDATVALYALEAAGLREVASAHAVTKGAAAKPDGAILREVMARGARALLVVADADEAGERAARHWVNVAQEVGLAAATFDLVGRGLVAPSLGEKDLRDAFRRQSVGVMAALKEAVEALADGAAGPVPWRTLDEAEGDTHVTWAWEGYIGYGCVTLLSARPKWGKSTLIWHLLRALASGAGEFLGQEASLPEGAWALVATEEPPAVVIERAQALGLPADGPVRVLYRKDVPTWAQALSVFERAANEGARLLVVDTFSAWAGVEDENAASHVEAAIRPLVNLAQRWGLAVVILHHRRKADGAEGTGHRGSSALVGAVDIAIEMKGEEGGPNRRKLEALSRFEATPRDLVIELQGGDYVAIGSGERAAFRRALRIIHDLLPGPDDEPTSAYKLAQLAREAGASGAAATTLARVLRWLAEKGEVQAIQLPGKAGVAYRWAAAGGQGRGGKLVSVRPSKHKYRGWMDEPSSNQAPIYMLGGRNERPGRPPEAPPPAAPADPDDDLLLFEPEEGTA